MPKLYRPEKIAIATSVASGARLKTLACIDRPIAMIAMPQKRHSTVRWLSLPAAGNSSSRLRASSVMAPIKKPEGKRSL
ncbi:Uncharacterised protein [Acinetobacter baumannii]|nr:Uncharacterised protein [Acinetobacter baumannii]